MVGFFVHGTPRKMNGWKLQNNTQLRSGKSSEPNLHDFANQLRLVVYPIIYRVSYIPGGARFLPSTVPRLGSKQLIPQGVLPHIELSNKYVLFVAGLQAWNIGTKSSRKKNGRTHPSPLKSNMEPEDSAPGVQDIPNLETITCRFHIKLCGCIP